MTRKIGILKLKFEGGTNSGKLRTLSFRSPKSFIQYPKAGFSIGSIFCKNEKEAIFLAQLIKTEKKKYKKKNNILKNQRKKRGFQTIDEILRTIPPSDKKENHKAVRVNSEDENNEENDDIEEEEDYDPNNMNMNQFFF